MDHIIRYGADEFGCVRTRYDMRWHVPRSVSGLRGVEPKGSDKNSRSGTMKSHKQADLHTHTHMKCALQTIHVIWMAINFVKIISADHKLVRLAFAQQLDTQNRWYRPESGCVHRNTLYRSGDWTSENSSILLFWPIMNKNTKSGERKASGDVVAVIAV